MLTDQEILDWLRITLPEGLTAAQKDEFRAGMERGLRGEGGVSGKKFRSALKQAVFETLEIIEHYSPEYVASLEEQLCAAGLPSIQTIAALKRGKLRKILETGKIRNDDEFRMLLELVEDQTNALDDAIRARVNGLLKQYDSSP